MLYIYLDDSVLLTETQYSESTVRQPHSFTKKFINTTPHTVHVKDRFGLETAIEPISDFNSSYQTDHFYIIDIISADRNTFQEYEQQARQRCSSERSYLMRYMLSDPVRGSLATQGYRISVLSKISTEKIIASGGHLYLPEHDIVLQYDKTKEQRRYINHPYSLVGNIHRIADINNRHPEDFNITITIIDNHNTFGHKWILVGSKPFLIAARQDLETAEGIYISYNKNHDDVIIPGNTLGDRYQFENRDELPYYKLYDSKAEALNAYAEISGVKEELKIKELEAKRISIENSIHKAEQDYLNLEHEARTKKERYIQEAERFERDNERLRREHENYLEKDRLDRESLLRKNTLEILKYVPALLSTVACIVAMLATKKQ